MDTNIDERLADLREENRRLNREARAKELADYRAGNNVQEAVAVEAENTRLRAQRPPGPSRTIGVSDTAKLYAETAAWASATNRR